MSKMEEDPYMGYFDQNGMLQISDILLKISSDENFLYIVKEQNLDAEIYDKLISEILDEMKMNKINIDRLEEDFDLFTFMDLTPFGINEPEYAQKDKIPFIGKNVALK